MKNCDMYCAQIIANGYSVELGLKSIYNVYACVDIIKKTIVYCKPQFTILKSGARGPNYIRLLTWWDYKDSTHIFSQCGSLKSPVLQFWIRAVRSLLPVWSWFFYMYTSPFLSVLINILKLELIETQSYLSKRQSNISLDI